MWTKNKAIKKLQELSSFFSITKVKLRMKLILPYLFLTFILALAGIFLVSVLISKSMEERFYSQLLSSTETTGETFKYREADQLSALRAMMYTKGVGEAVATSDSQSLYRILLPLKVNSHVYAVEVLDQKSQEILGIRGKKNTASLEKAGFQNAVEVDKVLNGVVDKGNDKFAFIYQESDGKQVFYTVGPIKHEGRVVGAIMAGTYLPSLLGSLKSQSLANVTFYNLKGKVFGTTIPNVGDDKDFERTLSTNQTLVRKVLKNPSQTLRETKKIASKQYDLVYVPLTAGGEAIGLYSVALRDKYFMVDKVTTRQSMVTFFMLGMLLVSLLGYALAKYISNPIVHLVEVAKNIGTGDLTQRAHVRGNDEISLLSKTFNAMSANIEDRTNQLEDKVQELTVLYQTSRSLKNSLDIQSIYKSVTLIFSESFKISTLLLLEPVENKDSLKVSIALNPNNQDIAKLKGREVKNRPEFQIHESHRLPADQDLLLTDVKNGEKPVSLRAPLLIPLRTKGKSLGVIILSEPENEMTGWANTPLLSTIGSEVAVAIENAHLYTGMSQRLSELSSLQKVGEAVTSTLRLPDIIKAIATHVKQVVAAANVSLILIDPVTAKLEVKFAGGPDADEISQKELKRSTNITWWVLKNSQPALLSEGRPDNIPLFIKRAYLGTVKDLLAVPLIAEGRPIGVLCVSNKIGPARFSSQDQRVLSTLASGAALSIKNAYLYQEVKSLFLSAVRSLVSAIDQKDPYTHGHSERVAAYSLMIAEELGLDEKEKENLEVSALLHDVGKIGISETILTKTSKLSIEEEILVREHPVKGVRIMEPMMEMKEIIPGMLYHHERYDGKGYPEGLKKLDIPLHGRIIAVADSFDAMNSNRPYRKRLSAEAAIKDVIKNSGTQFDPMAAKAFATAIAKLQAKKRVRRSLAKN